MTTMDQFKKMSIQERYRVKFAPMGNKIYNGLGYMITDTAWSRQCNTAWTAEDVRRLNVWAKENNCVWDGPILVFPDDETFIMCKMIFE